MRSHAKAATAGSTKRQANGLGRFLRGAFAGGAASLDVDGSSAPAARRLVLPVGVFAALLALMAFAIPASATKTHLFKEVFGSAAQPSFGNARALAVDQSSGDVLVMDAGETPSIKRYNADGTPADFSALATNVIDGQGTGDETPQNGLSFSNASESQIAVDNSGGATDGNIYVTQGFPNLINVFAEDGEYLGQLTAAGATPFSEACGVAVDPSGAVYVGDYSSGIHKFVPAANLPVNADNTATFTTVSNPCSLAAGAGPTAGFLFATYLSPTSKIDSSSGELKYTISTNHMILTVDPGTGHLYGTNGSTNGVEEFDASGAASATQVSTVSPGTTPQGLAVSGSGELYVSRNETDKVEVFGPLVTVPAVVTEPASNIDETTATLNGTVNPDGVALEECKFEYGTSTSYGQSVPCAESAGAIGTGTDPVPVHADISGLSISTTYHFRLVARNANDTVEGADGEFESLSTPAIKAQWAEGVTRTEATLRAKINPKGFVSTYHIEYGTTDSYGQTTPEVGIGSDSADHILTRALSGLTPSTTYHYRFVATNAIGTTMGPDLTFTTYDPAEASSCANEAFRTGPAARLADCRAYEMVSPVDKDGGEITTAPSSKGLRTAYIQSSVDGEKITYSSSTSFGDQISGHYSNQYLASRGADGWATHGINAPHRTTIFDPIFSPFVDTTTFFTAFTDDLSSAWLEDFNRVPLTPDGQANHMNLYRRDSTDGSFEALTVNAPIGPAEPLFGELFSHAQVQGFSDDGSRVFFAAHARFTPEAASVGNRQLYEFFDGELRVVSILPNGEASTTEFNDVGKQRHGGWYGGHREATRRNAVSDDGSRIFWTAGEYSLPDGPLTGSIYVRVDGDRTLPVSSGNALWWTAKTDGSNALFSEGALSLGDAILKEFDVDDETTTPIAGGIYGVVGASDDFSHIYYVSGEVLDTGAAVGQPNLYLDHEGTTTFIATVSPQDIGKDSEGPAFTDIASPIPDFHSSRVTPDGRHIAFTSHRSLTGYDNTDVNSGAADMEVFHYSADTQQLICASCNPSGARPTGTVIQEPFSIQNRPVGGAKGPWQWAAAWLTTEESSLHTSRPLSDDGNRLFFNAFDALVPEDSNGAQDVYEWRADGSGTCQKAAGCISLVSSGESPDRSEFVDASADGRDVFFETKSSLDPRDPGLFDIYDARIGGGYPYTAPSTPCVGDACQNVPPPPKDATPASANFKGAGDPKPRKPRPRCRARSRKAAKGSNQKAKRKAAKRCRGAKRGAGR